MPRHLVMFVLATLSLGTDNFLLGPTQAIVKTPQAGLVCTGVKVVLVLVLIDVDRISLQWGLLHVGELGLVGLVGMRLL